MKKKIKYVLPILLAALMFSCSSDDSNNDDDDNDNPGLAYYTNAKINGTQFSANIPVDVSVGTDYGGSMSYSPQYNNDGACVNINYEPSLYPTFNESLGSMGVGFIGFLRELDLSCSDELTNFDTIFTDGPFSYTDGDYGYGVKVNYATTSDETQQYYTSYGGSQDNSTFQITNVEPTDCGFKECLIITGTFSCNVYNEQDDSDMIEITDGQFKLLLSSFNP